MKRKLIGLLCACMLLSGCRVGSTPTVQTEPPPTQTPTTQPEAADTPLLEQGTALEESSNLLYIPNGTLEGMIQPQMRLLGNGLLLTEYKNGHLILNHISLENGALVASGRLLACEGSTLYIGSSKIAVCDRESSQVSVLDESFNLLRSYKVELQSDEWYLSPELDTLYILVSDKGVMTRDLESGEENWLLDQGFQVSGKSAGNGYLIFEYTDRADQKTYTRCLNLATATMETLPVDGFVSNAARQADTWLIQNKEGHVLVQGDTAHSVVWDNDAVTLAANRQHLLTMDHSRRTLFLYQTDGTFISQCSLPASSYSSVGPDFVWSGYWGGYFFTDYNGTTSQLMFWDVTSDCDGEDLQLAPLGAAKPPEPVVEKNLYERAQALSQRFGVDIRIAEQCAMDYDTYDTYALNDPVFIRENLDQLEKVLSRYPDGFFTQLCYGSIETVRFEIVGALMRKEGVVDHRDSAGGFAQKRGDHYLIALNGYLIGESTIYHEISHIIDKRLAWDAQIREDALFSEDRWLALQPAGFEYTMSYVDAPPNGVEPGYFVSDYAMTFPTEDRAELMETAMTNAVWCFEPGSGQRAKMQFYADCIRDCFDTSGWPETTVWEQVLQ